MTSAVASADAQAQPPQLAVPGARLTPLAWGELAGWPKDDHAAAFATFLVSCRPILARERAVRPARALDRSLAAICRAAQDIGPVTRAVARKFFESRFRPVRIAREDETRGLLTGYYEPVVDGSRTASQEFSVPLYRRPPDLVDRSEGPVSGAPQGEFALRRVGPNRYLPYHDRGEIEDGALAGRGLEICWLNDPIEAFFVQIQGSARIRLRDGTMLRLNYAARNGYPYTSVGAVMLARGVLPREAITMDAIRTWMRDNPHEAKALRRENRSYVFFRTTPLKRDQEAIGGQGVVLTAGRSIAIDRKLHAYGTPFWIDATLPLRSDASSDSFRRLMIAQDTGSAIVGPARADIYFGGGAEWGRVAGRIKHQGTFVMLVPATLFPAAGKAEKPRSPSKP